MNDKTLILIIGGACLLSIWSFWSGAIMYSRDPESVNDFVGMLVVFGLLIPHLGFIGCLIAAAIRGLS